MYYVYELIDPRNMKVFYVGKGKGKRIRIHVLSVRRQDQSYRKHNPKLFNKISKILSCGHNVIETVVKYFEDEKEAFEFEVFKIETYGLDKLCNLLPGGKGGISGDANPSKRPEVREKLREMWRNQNFRDRVSQSLKAFWSDPRNKKLMSEKLKGLWTDNMKTACGERSERMWQEHPEMKTLLSQRMTENNPTKLDEVRRKISLSWTNERKIAFRAKMSGLRHPVKKPETREKIRAAWSEEKRIVVGDKVRRQWTEERRIALGERFRNKAGPNPKLSFDDIGAIKRLYDEGVSRKELAIKYCVSKSSIHKVIHQTSNSRGNQRTVIEASRIQQVGEMRHDGLSYKDIATKLGVSIGAVRNFLKRHFEANI